MGMGLWLMLGVVYVVTYVVNARTTAKIGDITCRLLESQLKDMENDKF